jgi:molybdenum cofactor synthesis domain-containing protein
VIRALAITVSNRASAGVYEDKSGPVLASLLADAGCEVAGPLVIPDGSAVELALQDAVAAGYDVVVTTGGTGLTPGDATPEMTKMLLDREIPGIPEAIRAGPGRGAVPWRGGHGRIYADCQPARLNRRRPGRHGRPGHHARPRGGPDPGRRSPPAGRCRMTATENIRAYSFRDPIAQRTFVTQ